MLLARVTLRKRIAAQKRAELAEDERRLTRSTHAPGRAPRARDGHHARHPRGVVRRRREGRRARASPRSASPSASSPRSRSSRCEFAFEALTPGTMAEGATLVVTHGRRRSSRCRECGLEYDHDRFEMLCPACGSFNVEPLTGRELRIDSIEADDGSDLLGERTPIPQTRPSTPLRSERGDRSEQADPRPQRAPRRREPRAVRRSTASSCST